MSYSYDDIIGLPHHTSKTRPRMPIANRAAQFASFAALSGYDDAIIETARLTDKRLELDEYAAEEIGKKLGTLAENIADNPEITVIYFLPDSKKEGGAYVTISGRLKKVDEYECLLVFMNGEKVKISDVLNIECKLFD